MRHYLFTYLFIYLCSLFCSELINYYLAHHLNLLPFVLLTQCKVIATVAKYAPLSSDAMY